MSAELEKDIERERLAAENAELRRRIEELTRRVEELETLLMKLGGTVPTQRLDQAYSLKAEEQRQAVAQAGGKKRRKKQKSSRRGRVADGGQSFYFCGDHRQSIPILWHELTRSGVRVR
jgi:hypothetical protein